MTFDYTDCETLDPSPSASELNLVDMKDFSYSLKAGSTDAPFSTPQFAFVDRSVIVLQLFRLDARRYRIRGARWTDSLQFRRWFP